MSPRSVGLIIALVLVLAAAGTTALFWVQNSARTVMLSLNLGVTKFMLAQPVSAPTLMAICLGIGFLVGVIFVLALRLGGRRRRSATPSYDPSTYSSSAYGSGSTTSAASDRG